MPASVRDLVLSMVHNVADGFVSASNLELGIYIVDMVLDRLLFDVERSGNFSVSFAQGDEIENLLLPCGEGFHTLHLVNIENAL